MTARGRSPGLIVDALTSAGVEFVALTFVDNAGIARAKCCPVGELASVATAGVGASYTFGVFTGLDAIAASRHYGSRIGDLRLRPDLGALASYGAWAWAPCDQFDQDGAPWPLDPRGFLRRMTEAAQALGYELWLAWELEFFVARPDGTPINDGPAYGANAAIATRGFFEALARRLAGYGIKVPQFHAEYGAGQLEFSLPPRSPLAAADEAVLARWAVHETAHDAGLKVSFSPVVAIGGAGNGQHVHASLWRDGVNLFGSASGAAAAMHPDAAAFLAGVHEALPALTAIGCASPLSYERLRPGTWSGAFQCWGTENREAALRFIPGSASARPTASNLEAKIFDPSGNPYLVGGAVIAAGLDGVRRGLAPPPETLVDPSALSACDREAAGIGALPGSLAEAADRLAASAPLRTALGDDLLDAIVAVRRAEAGATAQLQPSDLAELYRWRY